MSNMTSEKKIKKLNDKFSNEIIYIKDSTIENAGLGVFAKKKIKKNTKIGEYSGKIYTDMSIMNSKTKDTNYFFEVNDYKNKNKFIIDAKPLKYSNFTRFINGVFDDYQKEKQNCKFYQNNNKIFAKTISDINPDEELLIHYGDSYYL